MLNAEPMTLYETAMSYEGRLRSRYLAAWQSLEESPLCREDFKLSPFLKAEKLNPNKVHKPRMIMPRTPRYNLVLASYLKNFEHELYRRWKGPSGKRIVAKGMNPVQRAKIIEEKFLSIPDCVVVEVDGAQFEAHQTRDLLKEEHSVYLSKFPNLRWMLEAQLTLEGRTSEHIKFSRPGCRASGDFNTGLGTTICMTVPVMSTMRILGIREYDLLSDGDNCLLFLHQRDLPTLMSKFYDQMVRSAGLECTIENPVYVMEQITFGQSPLCGMALVTGWCVIRGKYCLTRFPLIATTTINTDAVCGRA